MSTSFKNALLTGAAALVLAAGGGAAIADDEETASDDVIRVTGSRIRASGFSTPTPVTVVTNEELEMAVPGNLVTAIVQLPQFYNSTTTADPGNFFASPGAGNLNLRGLGTDRTLVLLDGRRLVSSTRYGGTDINTLPEEIIARSETVTGGASAAYGTDAVAGVVNFVLNTDYVGARAHAQYGITERSDNENWEAGFSYGRELGDRGHLLLSGEKFEQEGVFGYENRDWYEEWGIVSGGAGQPTRLVRPNVRSSVASLDGVIIAPAGSPLEGLEFLPDGTTRQFMLGAEGARSGPYASHVWSPGLSGTDNNQNSTVQPETSRESYFAYLDYDLTDNLTVYGQGIWGQNDRRESNLGGFYVFPFEPLTIYAENAFLPDNISQIMADNDIESFRLQRVGSALDTGRNAAAITENRMYLLTAGFDASFFENGFGEGGAWFSDWAAHGYYQNGETDVNARQRGGIRLDRIPIAIDAVDDGNGNIVCRVNTEPFLSANGGRWSDCEPLNMFGRGNASFEAVDWVTGWDPGQHIETVLEYTDTGTSLGLTDRYISESDKVTSANIEQDVFEVNFDGTVWEGWGAGPISAAFGFHYREESINQIVRIPVNPSNSADARPVPADDPTLGVRGSPGFNVANSVAIQFSKVPNIRGTLDTTEYFGELLVPVIADQPWMEQLNVSIQGRRADFSGSGEIDAWKYGVDAQITDEIRVRGTQSRDIRAANLSERFDRTGGFANLNCYDPPSPIDDANLTQCPIFIVSGGDPSVQPEISDTTTVGVIYQPNWFDGFQIAVDWYDIDLSDAIATLTAQQIYDECYINGDQTLCARIELGDNGLPVLVNQSVLNINKAKVTGIDVEAAYRRSIELFGGGESIAGRLFVGYQDENSRTNFGAPTVDSSGNYLFPELKVTGSLIYDRGPLSLFIQERYISETNRDNTWVEGVDIDNNTVDSVWYTDFNASYSVETQSGEVQLFGNIANVLDEDPPVVANFANFGAASNQILGSQFDRLGRRFTVGVRLRY